MSYQEKVAMKIFINDSSALFQMRWHYLLLPVFILMIAVITSLNVTAAEEEDIAVIIAQELDLDQGQTDQLRAQMKKFGDQLEALMAEQEGEDADPEKMINGIKQAQDAHNKEVEKIMGKDKFKQYEAMKEKAIKGIFADLIEIQLMDVQPKTSLSNDQVTKLAGVLGDSKYRLIQVAWENAGKSLRPRQKIQVAKQLKGIQRDARAGIEGILTPEQLAAWDKHMEEQKKK
jgi:hypothetical protein